jgi:hypothetical protein
MIALDRSFPRNCDPAKSRSVIPALATVHSADQNCERNCPRKKEKHVAIASEPSILMARKAAKRKCATLHDRLGRLFHVAEQDSLEVANFMRAHDRILGERKDLASFNMKKACNMLCGKGRVRTQDLGYQAER